MIITVGSTKGGVGKSTIACNLAVAASNDRKSVLLVDTDPQASTLAFRASRDTEDIQAIQITTSTLHRDLIKFNNYELIIVDSGGRDNSTFRSSIMACDILLVPCLPSTVDFWAASDVMKIVEEAKSFKDVKSYFLLNQVIPNTIISSEIVEAIRTIENGIDLMKTKLYSRVVYKNSFVEGKGVLEMKDLKAIKEINLLYNEIKEIIGI